MAPNSVQSTTKGWMPGATPVAIPASNFKVGNSGRKAAVIHIVEGSAGSALSEFSREGREKSAHFVVGKSGAIFQCVSVIDSAFANGLSWNGRAWIDPQGHTVTPTWQLLTPPTNPNWTTISIEREGYYQEVPPPSQDAAVVRILQYLTSQFPTAFQSWSFMQTLIGHRHISPITKANCPGPNVNYAQLAQAANGTPPPRPQIGRYVLVSPCTPFTARNPSAPLAQGVVFSAGDIVQVGQTQDGWAWVSDKADTAPGIGFLPLSYLKVLE